MKAAVFSPLRCGTCPLQPLRTGCRSLCSSQNANRESHQSHGLRLQPGDPELSLLSLLDMGFTDSQAQRIYEDTSKLRGGSAACKHALSTLTALFVLGLNPSSVLKLLEKCPELYTVRESLLQQRIGNLRKLGLVEGELMIFLRCCRWIYFMLMDVL